LSSRSKCQLSAIEFELLNVTRWPLWKAFHNGHHGKMLFMESAVSARRAPQLAKVAAAARASFT
jgi:hypothetical protein